MISMHPVINYSNLLGSEKKYSCSHAVHAYRSRSRFQVIGIPTVRPLPLFMAWNNKILKQMPSFRRLNILKYYLQCVLTNLGITGLFMITFPIKIKGIQEMFCGKCTFYIFTFSYVTYSVRWIIIIK